jgi:hypothetical protein
MRENTAHQHLIGQEPKTYRSQDSERNSGRPVNLRQNMINGEFNSNFGLLDKRNDLHASPAPIGRIKKHKELKKHKTPKCSFAFFSRLTGAFRAFRADLLRQVTRRAVLSRTLFNSGCQ